MNGTNYHKKLKGWVIYPLYVTLHNDYAFDWIAGEALKYNVELEALYIEDIRIEYGRGKNGFHIFYKNIERTELPDFVFVRAYDTIISSFFEGIGIKVINTTLSMFICKNKILTHQFLTKNNFPMPHTVYTTDAVYNYEELRETFGSNRFVVKIIEGSKGDGVYLVNNAEELHDAVSACKGKCFCQEFIDTSEGRDVRVWVVGDRIAGSVLRYSDTSFKSNYSQGGSVKAFQIDDETAEMCIAASRLIGLQFAGVDLLFGGDGKFMICEINGNAGFRTLSVVLGHDNPIPEVLFEYISSIFYTAESV